MAFTNINTLYCDVMVIGGGGAGLRAAIAAREKGVDVIIVSKSRVGYGNNTFISGGTFAAATGWRDSRDNPGAHMRDSVIGGRFINDQKLLKRVTHEALGQISFLEKCGSNFSRRENSIRITHLPGHSYPRHVQGEHQSGRDFTIPLRAYANRIGIRFIERVFITRLITSRGRIAAATGIAQDGTLLTLAANSIVLATGGFAQVYSHNNNAVGMTGDGHALAFELGVPHKDMEFIQFYPTALGRLGSRLFSYEAFVFQAGAVLRNAQGDDIIAKHGLNDPLAMTRDRLTRAVMQEIMEGRDLKGGVMADLKAVPEEKLTPLRHRLPAKGPQEVKEFIVSPTAHFCMGGITIGEDAEAILPGLFAAGEVCAGVHGANRLGGNALSEVFTMGGVAGMRAALHAREAGQPDLPEKRVLAERERLESLLSAGGGDLGELRRYLKDVMWFKAGIIRNKEGLEGAMERIMELTSYLQSAYVRDGRGLIKYLELRNMLLISEMVCRAALLRTESRGSHYRSDYPEEDNDRWLKNIQILKQNSKMSLESIPVPTE